MNLRIKSFFIVALLFCSVISAQEIILKGTVTSKSDEEPVLGANILIKGTQKGTNTDFDGKYQIAVKQGDIIIFSYLGFKTKSVIYVNQKTLNIQLEEDANELDEIVIVGYGTQKKSHLTGAISKIKSEKLDEIPLARVDDALVGQIAGVNIQSGEGTAGAAPTIRIRGTGSISGSSDPAIVVDGVVVENDFLTNIDMNDVASFEVLKDAASAAIYGSRGANGVIIITTKSGEEGNTQYSYNTFTGFKEGRQSDAYYFSLAEHAKKELAATGALSDRTIYKQLLGVDRDWQDVMFEGGTIQSHSFSARGGDKKTNFSFTMGYQKDEGVLIVDQFTRYNASLKLSTQLNKRLKIGVNLSPSYSDRERLDGSPHDVVRQTPWLPIYHNENTLQYVNRNTFPDVRVGDYAVQRHFDGYVLPGNTSGTNIAITGQTNPYAKVVEKDRNDYRFKFRGSFYANYKIISGLYFKSSVSGDFSNTKTNRWIGVLSSQRGAAGASLDENSRNALHYVFDNLLTYKKDFKKHEINAVLGISKERWNWDFHRAIGIGYDNDLIKTLTAASSSSVIQSERYERGLLSYLGRLNYAYADKYLLSLSLRSDGYSSFGINQKYGYFPAASVGWTVTKEGFLKNNNIISFLKLRGSFGVTGNPLLRTGDNVVDSYPYLSLVESSTAVIDGSATSGFNISNIANPGLQWEQSVEINPGIDFGFFKNRITGSVDFYQRTSDDLLLFNPISVVTGFNNAVDNLGKVRNSGFEFEMKTKNISTRGFKWSTNFVASRNKNELLDFADADGQILNVDSRRPSQWINKVGNPVSSFYGWVVDKEISFDLLNPDTAYSIISGEPGHAYVKDLNGDGIIDEDDKTILGNPYPDFIWSVTNEFNIKNFSFSFMFQGSHGSEVSNIADQYLFSHTSASMRYDESITPATPTSTQTVADLGGSNDPRVHIKQKIFTDAIIQDASYLALRNVNIGYTLSDEAAEKIGISKLRIFASGQNLLYFTSSDYTGFNPETSRTTSTGSLTEGYQRGGFPITQTISLGLNVQF